LTAVNFPSGRFRCENALLDLTLAEDVKQLIEKSGDVVETTRRNKFSWGVTGLTIE
jgi:hypothetical protein